MILSEGNHTIHIDKEIIEGTADEGHDNKVKGKWNVVDITKETLQILEQKVIDEKKNKKIIKKIQKKKDLG